LNILRTLNWVPILACLLTISTAAGAQGTGLSVASRGDTGTETDAGRSLATIAPTELTDEMRAALLRAQGVTQIRGPSTVRRTPIKLFNRTFRDAAAARHAEDIAALTQALIALDPDVVDPAEAARAARAVYTYVDQLIVEYEIADSPLVHNTKVNFGAKPRGLCWHWAHDVDSRLQMEHFRTLRIHRAIANYNNIRLEHSTSLRGPRGGEMMDAMVLDPWREGGKLVWKIAREDTRYNWTPRQEVFVYKRNRDTGRSNGKPTRSARFDINDR